MKKRNFGWKVGIGIGILLLAFVIAPISPSISLAAEATPAAEAPVAAQGVAGGGAFLALTPLMIVGLAAFGVIGLAAIISAASGTEEGTVTTPAHH